MNDTVLFTGGNERFTPGHLLAASALWGELDSLEAGVRRRAEAIRYARSRNVDVADEVLQRASEAFRRAYALRTARATEAWMAARGVSLEDFTDFLERDALDQMNESPPTETGSPDSAVSPDMLWKDAVFTGLGDHWGQRLAARVAVARETTPSETPASLFEPIAPAGLAPDALHRRATQFDWPGSWVETTMARERQFARFAESVQTPDRLEAAMRARWDALFSMEFELGAFASEAAAREACLCVTEDGDPIEAVCEVAGGAFQGGRVLLGDLPDEIRPHALSATAGSLLPVFDWNGNYIVCRVRGKTEPSLDDAQIREAVARDVLMEAIAPLVDRHITWAAGFAP